MYFGSLSFPPPQLPLGVIIIIPGKPSERVPGCVCVCVRARAHVCVKACLRSGSPPAARPGRSAPAFPPVVFVKCWASQSAPPLSTGELGWPLPMGALPNSLPSSPHDMSCRPSGPFPWFICTSIARFRRVSRECVLSGVEDGTPQPSQMWVRGASH